MHLVSWIEIGEFQNLLIYMGCIEVRNLIVTQK